MPGLLALQSAPASGVIVRILEPPDTRMHDIVIGVLKLSGGIAIGALVIGLIVGGLVFWKRSKSENDRTELKL